MRLTAFLIVIALTAAMKGEQVCLSQTKPRLPGSLCHRFPTRAGVAVEARDPAGKKV